MLSVHVKSQIDHQPPDFAQQLAEGVRLFIANEGYNIPPPEVTEALKGDINLTPQNLLTLLLKHGYDKDRAARSMAKGAEILSAQIAANRVVNGVGVIKSKLLEEIKVDDIQKFRSTLRVGESPAPVQPLETFYECQSPRL